MEILVILYSILAFFVSLSILGVFGQQQDIKQRRIEYIDGINKMPVFEDLDKSFFERFIVAPEESAQQDAEDFSRQKPRRCFERKIRTGRKALRLAGVNMSAPDFMFLKNIGAIILTIIALIVSLIIKTTMTNRLLITAMGLLIGMIIPTYILRSKVTSYQEAIRNQLPDALDLLGVCIERVSALTPRS